MGKKKLDSGDVAGAGSGAAAAASSSNAPGAETAASSSILDNSSKLADQRTSAFGHVLEDVVALDERKVADAVEREKKRQKKEKGGATLDEERQRGYNASAGERNSEISAEEYEAYRLAKMRSDDPMAKFT